MGNKTLETLSSGFRVLRALVFSLSLPVSVCRQFGTNSLHVFEDTGSITVMELSRCEPDIPLACLHPRLGFLLLFFLGPNILPDWQELASFFFFVPCENVVTGMMMMMLLFLNGG